MRRVPCVLALVAAALGAPSVHAQAKPAEGNKVYRDLEYVKDGHERQKLDLFLPPKAGGPLPLVVLIHGGGWQNGSKDQVPAQGIAAQGYAVARINYRLVQHAVFPAQIEDCKAAIRWLRANARTYNIDPDHVAVWGSSAGGHLAALLGTSADVKQLEGNGGNLDQPSRVQAVIDWFGPTDLLHVEDDSPHAHAAIGKLLGGPLRDRKELAALASPVTHVTKQAAPFLMLHGDKDPVVPFRQSEILAAALEKAGVEVTLKKVEGGGHGGPAFNSPENVKLIEAFLEKHLKKSR
jgi:acetyl esterase/lipase